MCSWCPLVPPVDATELILWNVPRHHVRCDQDFLRNARTSEFHVNYDPNSSVAWRSLWSWRKPNEQTLPLASATPSIFMERSSARRDTRNATFSVIPPTATEAEIRHCPVPKGDVIPDSTRALYFNLHFHRKHDFSQSGRHTRKWKDRRIKSSIVAVVEFKINSDRKKLPQEK